MPLDDALRRFCLAHAAAFVVPAEHLSAAGMDPELAQLLIEDQRLSAAQLRCLEQGFALYWERCSDLFARAPGTWFAPRRTNLLVVSDPRAVMPYLEPFSGTSALLYLSDLDTDPEYVAYLLVHNERLPTVGSVRGSLVCNLSYWMVVDAARRAAFARAAAAATRPDAAAFVQLARVFDWIDDAYHDPLRHPDQDVTEPYIGVNGADVYVPRRVQPQLAALCEAADHAQSVALRNAARFARTARASTLDELCDWMRDSRAHLILRTADGQTPWSPGSTDPSAVRRALRDVEEEAARSLLADLAVVHERTRTFFAAMRDPDSLPRSCAMLETGGGAYVDAARRAMVYELKQPGFDSTSGPAPPYHRLLLGARVMHEWGHLAHAGKYLRVTDERRPAYREARAELGERFLQVLNSVPPRLRSRVDDELRALSPQRSEAPAALARKTLARVGDYLSNLMSMHLIPGEEMQAYVRTNVRHHMNEGLGLIDELARYAYEVHYLALAALDRSYFMVTSRVPEYLVHTGVVRADDLNALFDAAGRVLGCYSIDADKLALPVST